MLRRSVHSKCLALALIVLTVLGTSASWHADADDVDAAVLEAHNHADHHGRLERWTRTGTGDHCAICHWLRSFRTDGTRQVRVQRPTGPQGYVAAMPDAAFRATIHLELPSRAPPRA